MTKIIFVFRDFIFTNKKMKKMKKLILKMKGLFKEGCPRCGEYYDRDVCQTCGYPWS